MRDTLTTGWGVPDQHLPGRALRTHVLLGVRSGMIVISDERPKSRSGS